VTLKTKDDGSGQIVIAYGDHEELDRLVQRLRARA
jgi:hypothetical protein